MSGKCAKCKACPSFSGDTWCLGCSSWESIGRDLSSRWEGPPGIREIANNLAVNCAREIRALRGLGTGLAVTKVKEEVVEAPSRTKVVPPGLAAKSKAVPDLQEASEYTEAEEEESEEESEHRAPGVDTRPSLPRCRSSHAEPGISEKAGSGGVSAGSGRAPAVADKSRAAVVKEEDKDSRRGRGEGRERDHRGDRSRDRKGSKRKREDKEGKEPATASSRRRKGHRRGGRKHQRLGRLATDPYTPHHRKLSEDFLRKRDRFPRDSLP